MSNVVNIFPANSFHHVAENAKKDIVAGIVIGYDDEGNLTVYGGGMIDGRQPVCHDWLWMIEAFKQKMLAGDYS